MQPLVSLLIPTFNSGLTVGDAVQSCCEQTYGNLEILVYDEASKDNTREVIQDWARRDSRIRVLTSDKNSGPVRAWRVLLQAAKGKYSTFVWADDLILPRYVEKLCATLEANPTHLSTGCTTYTGIIFSTPDPGNPVNPVPHSPSVPYPFPTCRLRGDEYALGIMAGVFPVTQICSLFNTVAAREIFDHYIDFPNPFGFDFSRRAYGNDVSFLSELALRAGEVIQTGEPLVVCRASPDSMTVNATRHHKWQFWFQYVYAIRSAWTRCRNLSPRMDELIQIADDRANLIQTIYLLDRKKWPAGFNPIKCARAAWFLMRHDRRINKEVGPEHIVNYLADWERELMNHGFHG